MFFLLSSAVLVIVSIGLAFVSLQRELQQSKHRKIKEVKESLAKGKVLFYSPSSSSSED